MKMKNDLSQANANNKFNFIQSNQAKETFSFIKAFLVFYSMSLVQA